MPVSGRRHRTAGLCVRHRGRWCVARPARHRASGDPAPRQRWAGTALAAAPAPRWQRPREPWRQPRQPWWRGKAVTVPRTGHRWPDPSTNPPTKPTRCQEPATGGRFPPPSHPRSPRRLPPRPTPPTGPPMTHGNSSRAPISQTRRSRSSGWTSTRTRSAPGSWSLLVPPIRSTTRSSMTSPRSAG